MPKPYEKKHLTYEEQVAKLAGRGLEIPDHAAAAASLRWIGYYRLTGYLHTFRPIKDGGASGHDERENRYVDGSTFEQAVNLWKFDRQLRMVLLDGLEQFEIALRTALAYSAGKLDPFVHYRPDLLAPQFTQVATGKDGEPRSRYDEWMDKYLERVESSKNEAFVKWFVHKYDGRLPIWTAIEVMEFGQTARLIQGLPTGQRREISAAFGLSTPRDFGSWIASLNGVRNICAHHSRLWNRTLVTTPGRPKEGQVPDLDHLHELDDVARVKIYAPVAILVWLMRESEFGLTWRDELLEVLRSFPDLPQGSLSNAGFPTSWQRLDLWT